MKKKANGIKEDSNKTQKKLHLYRQFELKDIISHFIEKDVTSEKIQGIQIPWKTISEEIKVRSYND